MKDDARKYRAALLLLFWSYTLLIVWEMLIGPYRLVKQEWLYNVVPFRTITYMFTHCSVRRFPVFLINIVANIVVFIPFGGLAPLVYPRRFAMFKRTLLTFALIILLLEVLQLLLQVGMFDVDDILLNCVGIAIGFQLHRVLSVK